ncbi:MAG: hydrogenase formation protein HypD, partial [Candidatus Omnitrophica bacterium]|nr:hydrogenase formation protein HypD [Candidatus Omnitrophota bacterium]
MPIRLMEVCGTHTMAIARSGIKKLLPEMVELISGPGCPVCVTAQGHIDRAIAIAAIGDVIMTTFGDMMRVPGSRISLEEAKAKGADVRIVYSCLDALTIARENPQKRIVFMGVGFETTSPTVAATVKEAKRTRVKNFFLLSNFKVLFPALSAIASSKRTAVDGFICPGHVSVITGSIPYEKIASRYKKPCVITGFDDIDILQGIKRLLDQAMSGRHEVEIEYKKVVTRNGNKKARDILDSVFSTADTEWRGLGINKRSGLKLNSRYRDFDAEREFKVRVTRPKTVKGCICGEVLQGIKAPSECRLFGKACTTQKPIGPCMVSSEGTCAAYY